jgi:probable rRNA maturation factor
MEITALFEEGVEGDLPSADWLKGVVEQALVAEQANTAAEVSLLIAGEDRVHELNRVFLGEDRPTDVLSFPMLSPAGDESGFVSPPDGLVHLGEVIISFPQAVTQAAEHKHSARREIALLAVHGVLHLLGYDHDEPAAESRMKMREQAILATIQE